MGPTRPPARRGARAWALAALCVSVCLAVTCAQSASAAALTRGRLHLHKATLAPARAVSRRPRWACPEGACDAIVAPRPARSGAAFVLPDAHHLLEGSGELGGYDPADLRSAYKIPTSGGAGQTIALIDAFGYPDAEADLAEYRSRYGLPPCTEENGCFEKVNEDGEKGNYPAEEPGWDDEAALDEDMASAACPECHILLVEGSTELPADLGAAVDTAVRLGATEVSNSYGYPERIRGLCGSKGCSQFDEDYEHPGVEIFAAAGDAGYEDAYFGIRPETDFPAASPDVVAVGGTALEEDAGSGRGWQEQVWNEPELLAATGSGCSKFESKPTWQTDTGCTERTDNDVAAVAAVETGVSVRVDGQWEVFGGTSVASPLVAGIDAHASAAVRALGAEAFYADPSSLFDVTEGFNWDPVAGASECAPNEYLCNAEPGYDGPTGMGTPDGVPADVSVPPAVTAISPNRGPASGGTTVTITGAHFEEVKEVRFGTAAAKEVKVASTTSITVSSPPGRGTVNVTVATAGGTSPTVKGDRFKYRGK